MSFIWKSADALTTAAVTVRSCAELVGVERIAVAELIHEALVEFYSLVPIPHPTRIAALADQLGAEGTELEFAITAVDGEGRFLGAGAAYPASEGRQRQMTSLLQLSRALDPQRSRALLRAANDRRQSIPEVPPASYYLARLAVAPAARGTGVALLLMNALQREGRHHPVLSLHVRADNARAIAFYRKAGFAISGSATMAYLCMTCRGAAKRDSGRRLQAAHALELSA